MKKLFIGIVVLLLFYMSGVFNYCLAASSIKFNNETYFLKYSAKGQAGYLNEYLKSGESLSNWNALVGVYNYPSLDNPKESVISLAKHLDSQNNGSIVICHSELDIVEFITVSPDKSFYEYNIMKYYKSKKNGLNMFQYAKRFYTKEHNGIQYTRSSAINYAKNNSAALVKIMESLPYVKVIESNAGEIK